MTRRPIAPRPQNSGQIVTLFRKERQQIVVNTLWLRGDSENRLQVAQLPRPQQSPGWPGARLPAAEASPGVAVEQSGCGWRAFTHLRAAAAFAVLRRHGALAAGAAGHIAGLILRHHRASLTILTLAAATAFAAGIAFATAGSSLAAACHSAVRLIMIAAGAGFGIVAAGSGRRLGRALRHQRQSHHYCA